MLVFDELLITYSVSVCIMCVMFVQRLESRGRRFRKLHIINIITVILNLFQNTITLVLKVFTDLGVAKLYK